MSSTKYLASILQAMLLNYRDGNGSGGVGSWVTPSLLPRLLFGVGAEQIGFEAGWRCFANPHESDKIKMKHKGCENAIRE